MLPGTRGSAVLPGQGIFPTSHLTCSIKQKGPTIYRDRETSSVSEIAHDGAAAQQDAAELGAQMLG